MSSPRRIAVVGAGPAGTALALGLVRQRYDVTLVSDRTAEEIRDGSVMSSQITFESALEAEAALGITPLLPTSPPIERMSYTTSRADGTTAAFTTAAPDPGPLPGPARAGAAAARGDRASGRQGRGPHGRRRRPRGPRPRPRPGRRLDRPRRARLAVRGGSGPHAVHLPAAGRVADLPARRDARPGRSRAALPLGRGRRRVLHVPGADRRRALRHRRRRGSARRPARLLGRRVRTRRPPAGAAFGARGALPGGGLADGRRAARGRRLGAARPDQPRRAPPGRHAAQRRSRAGHGRRRGAERPADQPGVEQRAQVGVVLPGGDRRARRPVRRGLDAADLRQLLARLGAVGDGVDELLAAARDRSPAARRGRGDPARLDRLPGGDRLRRRPAVQPLVVRRRRGRVLRGSGGPLRGVRLRPARPAPGPGPVRHRRHRGDHDATRPGSGSA